MGCQNHRQPITISILKQVRVIQSLDDPNLNYSQPLITKARMTTRDLLQQPSR